MNLAPSLNSPSRIAADLHRPVGEVLRVIDDLGLRPALRVDGRPLFDDEQTSRIASVVCGERPGEEVHHG